jgi:glycine/D-amino acid oxidase-like deaminating enzyme
VKPQQQTLETPDSLWVKTASSGPGYPQLEGQHSADICVIGGGFTGLSAALHSAEMGAQVILLEAAEPGWGASGRNGGQVVPGFKLDPDDMVKRFGSERGEKLAEFATQATDRVFDLARRHQIDCNARREGWIRAIHSQAALAEEDKRSRQWRERGVDIEILDRDETKATLGTNLYIAGAIDRRGGWVQPLAYVRGLARAARQAGARLHAASPATRITRIDKGWRVETPSGAVDAAQVIVCTNAYTENLWPRLARSLIPMVSYIAATEPLPEEVRKTILPKGQCASDTFRLLRYFCIDPDGRLVMGGRGRFVANPGPDAFGHIVKSIQAIYPQASRAKLQFYWSGHAAVNLEHFPHLFDLGPGLWAAAGYMGRGVAMATAMGIELARCVNGADVSTLPFIPTKPKPIPFHALRRPGVEIAVGWKWLQDAWDRRHQSLG